MKIALAHSHYDVNHLKAVKAEMGTLGAPVIKAVWMDVYGHFAAIEGCHRLLAAQALGLTPIIDEVEYSDEIAPGTDPSDEITIKKICDSSINETILEFAQ